MSCGPTHYAGCPCHEAGWEQRLAAAEAKAAAAEANNRLWHDWRQKAGRVFERVAEILLPIAHIADQRSDPEVLLPYMDQWHARLHAAEERAEKAETDLSDERAAHLVLASSLETQRQISRDTVGRAVEMERQRNDLRVRLAAAEADRDRLAREHEDCDAQRRSLVSQGLAAIRKAEAAEAYRDRLREALREMLSTPWGHAPDCEMRETPVEECGCADAPWVGIARRALAASEEKEVGR